MTIIMITTKSTETVIYFQLFGDTYSVKDTNQVKYPGG